MSSNVKVVLTGACATGKTSIITKLIYNTFDPNYISTEGGACGKFQFTYEKFNDYELTMDIWDTAGQDRYKSLTKIFYKNAEIAILVYEITNKKSFTDLKDYWIPQLKEAGINDIVIGIAANKCDLYAQEQVSEKEGLEFAKEINAIFKQTSALSNIGIQELFRELGLKYLQNKLQIQPNENTKTKDNKNNGTVKLENKSSKNNKENDKGCCK